MADDKARDDEIDAQSATALPQREAMSLIAPPPISSALKITSEAPATPGQGIDEGSPES